MSDEESFVILGTSPNSSLDMHSLCKTETSKESVQVDGVNETNGLVSSQVTTSSSSNESNFSVINNCDVKNIAPAAKDDAKPELNANGGLMADNVCVSLKRSVGEPPSSRTEATGASNTMKQSVGSNSSSNGDDSLAASFILGQVHSDVLKYSLDSQFPSIRSSGASIEDVVKMQNMLSEYLELKKTLMNTNLTMKQFYDESLKWKSDVRAMEVEHREEIAKLRNENLELRRDLETKVEQIKINEEAWRKEHEEFSRSLSEKSAQIQNMSVQIQKLEQQQLSSFDFISKNPNGTPQPDDAVEYVTTLEHRQVVKNFERQMSEIIAENLQLKDMQSQYIDEINCLKVNLVSAEELQNKARADINFLKASDIEKSEMFSRFENENRSLRIDMDVLRQQLDIYSRDFKMEQEARENLANEKDQLLSDLRELQRRNQDLIQEAQKNYEEHSRQMMAPTGAFPKTRAQPALCPSPKSRENPIYTPMNFKCPVCGQPFKTLGVLQRHVDECLPG